MSALTIGHANVRGRRRGVRVLARRGCDSIGVNEGWRLITWLLGLARFRVIHAEGATMRRSAETPILTRRRWPSLGALAVQISDRATPVRLAPARWLTVSLYRHDVGRVAHVNVHMHVVGRGTDTDRVREYHRGAVALQRIVELLKRLGFSVVVTGDVNVLEDADSHGWRDAYEALERAGMSFHTVGRLDVVAWDGNRLQLLDVVALPAGLIHSDHPGIVARFGPVA